MYVDPLADPGFGQGGGPENFGRNFADVGERSPIGRGPGLTLGPWKLWHFFSSNMHTPGFLGTFY